MNNGGAWPNTDQSHTERVLYVHTFAGADEKKPVLCDGREGQVDHWPRVPAARERGLPRHGWEAGKSDDIEAKARQRTKRRS